MPSVLATRRFPVVAKELAAIQVDAQRLLRHLVHIRSCLDAAMRFHGDGLHEHTLSWGRAIKHFSTAFARGTGGLIASDWACVPHVETG